MIDLLITDRNVSILHTEQIVSGNRNTYTVRYHFDKNSQVNWKHCMKVAVFASVSPIGAKKVRIAKLDAEDRCLIPQSILMHDAATVFAGVSGVYPNEDVVASQMCRIGAVDPGANGETFPMDEVPQSVMDSFLADVAELLAETSEKSHTHANMDTLDRIGSDGDNLTFDGVSVGGNDSRVDDLIYDVSSLQQSSHTHANMDALERIGRDTDDVVLLPMGEPLDLMIREDFASLQFPLLYGYSDLCEFAAVIKSGAYKAITVFVGNGESFINFHDTNASINVSTTDGLAWYDFDGVTTVDAPDLTGFKIDYFETAILGITSETLEDIEGNPEVLSMYKTLCRAINTSVKNMGSMHVAPDVVEALPANGVRANRTYAVNLGVVESFSMPFDRSSISGGDAYSVVYLNIQQDCDISFDADLYVGGEVPNTKAGMHKLIYNVLPDGQVSLGSLDLEAIV